MTATRREFLKIAGVSAIGLVFPALPSLANAQAAMPAAGGAPPGTREPLPALTAKRWAMAVVGGTCPAGCRACLDACHLAHNVPAIGNPKDDVHWIGIERIAHVFPAEAHPLLPEAIGKLSVPVLCNHCENPPCVRVCPTKATFKRPEDGIVMMDFHRCIGCRFCMAACPFGARRFNYRDPRPGIKQTNKQFPTRMKGVVEKCSFCVERLAEGKLPACVEASEGKIAFGDLFDEKSNVRELIKTHYTIRRKVNLGTEPAVYYIV